MSQFTRQHSSVELVELHQLDQVGEFGGAVVKAEENLSVVFALAGGSNRVEREEEIRIFSLQAPHKPFGFDMSQLADAQPKTHFRLTHCRLEINYQIAGQREAVLV